MDQTTENQLDSRAFSVLATTLCGEKTENELLAALRAIRFSIEIEEFQENYKSETAKYDFYFQNRKAIDNDSLLRHTFFNRFQILIPEDFYREVKKIAGYPDKFYDQDFRQLLLVEQEHKCGLCGRGLKKIHPHLHHIDYNKKNCSKENLIFLCPRCHGKTNSQRNFWQGLLTEKKQKGGYDEE